MVETLKPFNSKFLGKVITSTSNENLKGYVSLIKLIDLPDSPKGILFSEKRLKQNELVIAEVNPSSSQTIILPQEIERSLDFKHGFKNPETYKFKDFYKQKPLDSLLSRVCLKYNLPSSFLPEILPIKKEIKKLAKEVLKEKGRTNLIKKYTCTIDGQDAKDFDDAISIEETEIGFKLYVHIADVSHFVKVGSSLDKEAFSRANSYYLTTQVIPMLPRILSEEFCSLKPKTKRLTFTCEADIDRKGKIYQYKFYKSVIYIDKRFTYEEAEKELNIKNSSLKLFWRLALILTAKREAAGRIDLNIPEVVPVINSSKKVKALKEKLRLRSHKLIEECMLTANTCAADLARKNQFHLLYRSHDPIPKESLEKINTFLKIFGFKLQLKSLAYHELKKALKHAVKNDKEKIFNYLLLRSFAQASYTPKSKGHWGLAFKNYTHFTSPIRRYADLVIHRQIASFIKKENLPYGLTQLEEIGKQISYRERIALEAERSMFHLIEIDLLKDKIGEEFEAFLTGFNSEGLFIQLKSPMIEGFIPVGDFSRENKTLSLDDFRVVLPKFKKTILLGSSLKVILKEVNWDKMHLIFQIIKISK